MKTDSSVTVICWACRLEQVVEDGMICSYACTRCSGRCFLWDDYMLGKVRAAFQAMYYRQAQAAA